MRRIRRCYASIAEPGFSRADCTRHGPLNIKIQEAMCRDPFLWSCVCAGYSSPFWSLAEGNHGATQRRHPMRQSLSGGITRNSRGAEAAVPVRFPVYTDRKSRAKFPRFPIVGTLLLGQPASHHPTQCMGITRWVSRIFRGRRISSFSRARPWGPRLSPSWRLQPDIGPACPIAPCSRITRKIQSL